MSKVPVVSLVLEGRTPTQTPRATGRGIPIGALYLQQRLKDHTNKQFSSHSAPTLLQQEVPQPLQQRQFAPTAARTSLVLPAAPEAVKRPPSQVFK